ncbi:AAA family ATPase [Glycomyces albidus]|uniref:AAA family ATPase n=1 Tax=Glycomyces albidus TaxID=2656774 RepID=A0A6L5G389_9ACTN|nr:AAA family ATPase [Glycomyces albidus]MQM23991.1 AAA family ATPase [Glycomyces albidus]
MRRFILTGAPGAGKTTVARRLGGTVVEAAATDLITAAQAAGVDEPWTDPAFTEDVAALQRDRQIRADALPGPVLYFDRSPVCTLALARFLGHPVGPVLAAELDRIRTGRVSQATVLCFDLLGAITPTPARRIGLDQARAFELVHLDAYAEHGYRVERIPAAGEAERTALVSALAAALAA